MVVLPSSPVWYQSRGVDTSHNGMLAFASRNLVFLVDLTKKRPEIYGILSGHADKVTSCSFCPSSSQDHLLRVASGADDCTVKLWDVRQKLLISEHSAHGMCKVVSVHWSPVKPSLIFSGDEKGFVICWNVEKDTTDRFCPDGTSQMQLCCLTCSPFQENLIAVGYKSGAVSVMDINKNGTVIKKLRGHTNEVHAVVWAPNQDEDSLFGGNDEAHANGASQPATEQGQAFGVIASGSKDKTIKLWSVEKGKCVRTFRIPTRASKGRQVNEDAARLYVTLYWPRSSPTRFISSGYNGDIILWDLSPDTENSYEILASQTHDAGHHRIAYNITSGANCTNSIITTSMDRQILHWTIPKQDISASPGPDWTLPTLGGFVYAAAISPKDPSIVAIGVGDGMIRIWRTGSQRSAYDITTLWQGIKEKVMALCWHPTKDGCLAYATEDGKVGIYDTLSQRPPIIAETYHLKPVYALSWGPRCNAKTTAEGDSEAPNMKTPHLYSCGGDGVIYQHNPLKFSEDAVNIDKIIASTNAVHTPGRHSEVSWNQDGRLLAIGNDNGTINIHTSPHLLHIAEIKCHSKIVNCVRWKPVDDFSEDSLLQIASGSNSSVIFIHDLAKIFSENDYIVGDEIDQPILVSKQARSLVGHIARITGLSYNPRNPTEIVSSSYDGTAQVWDTETENPVSNFRGHHGRLMCVAWSSVTTDPATQSTKKSGLIFSGADDYTIHGWYAEDQQHTEPVKSMPDFGFGPKSRFQGKKKGRNKKTPPTATTKPKFQTNTDVSQNHNHEMGARNALSPDLDDLLEKKRNELLVAIGCEPAGTPDKAHGLGQLDNNSFNAVPRTSIAPKDDRTSSLANKPPMFPNKLTPHRQWSPGELKADASGDWRSGAVEEDFSGRKRKRLKNMFPQSVALDNRKKSDQHQDCVKIVKWKMADRSTVEQPNLSFTPGSANHINLGFYTDRRSAFRMMKNEAKKLEEDDVAEGSCNLKFWMGDVVGAIEEAIEKSQLTDHLVSMSPMAGHAFWRKTCQAFAKQLANEDHHVHAVHYLLASGDLHGAIQLLLDGRHYREAVALARARLSDDDPVLKKTVKLWALKLKNGGSVELAAKCFGSIGEFREAANCLSKRASSGVSTVTDGDVSSLWAAASVAQHAREFDLATEFTTRAVNRLCLKTWNWSEASEILLSFDNLQHFRLILMVHEMLATILCEESAVIGPSAMNKSNWNVNNLYVSEVKEDCPFPTILVRAWGAVSCSEVFPGLDDDSCQSIHAFALESKSDHLTHYKILYQVSVRLCAAIVTAARLSCRSASEKPPDNFHSTCKKHAEANAHNTSSETPDRTDWVLHLIAALKVITGGGKMNSELATKTLIRVVCETAHWAKAAMCSRRQLSPETEYGEIPGRQCKNLIDSLQTLCLNEMLAESDTGALSRLLLSRFDPIAKVP